MSEPLVTEGEVLEIYADAGSRSLKPFIDAAHLVIENRFGITTLSPTHLKEIERWLAAHFASCVISSTAEVSRDKIGNSEREYFRQSQPKAAVISSTKYGQQACLLDTTGVLATSGKQLAQLRLM
jgi:hypothetical protein